MSIRLCSMISSRFALEHHKYSIVYIIGSAYTISNKNIIKEPLIKNESTTH
jgi:hypothetical protein